MRKWFTNLLFIVGLCVSGMGQSVITECPAANEQILCTWWMQDIINEALNQTYSCGVACVSEPVNFEIGYFDDNGTFYYYYLVDCVDQQFAIHCSYSYIIYDCFGNEIDNCGGEFCECDDSYFTGLINSGLKVPLWDCSYGNITCSGYDPNLDVCDVIPDYIPNSNTEYVCGEDGNIYMNEDVMQFCYGINITSDPTDCDFLCNNGQQDLDEEGVDCGGSFCDPCPALDTMRPFVTTWVTNYPGLSGDSSIIVPTFPGETYNYEVDWDYVMGTPFVADTSGITGDFEYNFGREGTVTIAIRGEFPRIYFFHDKDNAKILSINQWGDINWKTMSYAFYKCDNLNSDALDVPDLSHLNDCSSMFRFAVNFNGNIKDWDVSNIIDLNSMFYGASKFNQDISAWDVSKASSMVQMFRGASDFNQSLGNWDVSSVVNMASMFDGASTFNQNLENWNLDSLQRLNYNWAQGVLGFFDNSGLSCENYSATLQGWASNPNTPDNLEMQALGMQFNEEGKIARDTLIAKGWTITGDSTCIITCSASYVFDYPDVICTDEWELNFIISDGVPPYSIELFRDGLSVFSVSDNISGGATIVNPMGSENAIFTASITDAEGCFDFMDISPPQNIQVEAGAVAFLNFPNGNNSIEGQPIDLEAIITQSNYPPTDIIISGLGPDIIRNNITQNTTSISISNPPNVGSYSVTIMAIDDLGCTQGQSTSLTYEIIEDVTLTGCPASSAGILCLDWLYVNLSSSFCPDPLGVIKKVYTTFHNGEPAILIDTYINCSNPAAFGADFSLYVCDDQGTLIDQCGYEGFSTSCNNPPTGHPSIGPAYDQAILIYDSQNNQLPQNCSCSVIQCNNLSDLMVTNGNVVTLSLGDVVSNFDGACNYSFSASSINNELTFNCDDLGNQSITVYNLDDPSIFCTTSVNFIDNGDCQVGPLEFIFKNHEIARLDTLTMNIRVANFNELVLFQSSINWDSTVLDFIKIDSVSSELIDFDISNFGTDNGADISNGELTVSWDHPQFNATDLPDSTVLFQIVFEAIGEIGDSTLIYTSDSPTDGEAVTSNFDDIGVVSDSSVVKIISNPSCQGTYTFDFPEIVCSQFWELPIEINGGQPPYEIDILSNGSIISNKVGSTGLDTFFLGFGVHENPISAAITDANGCTTFTNMSGTQNIDTGSEIEITLQIQNSPVCQGDELEVLANFSGGTAPYSFSISGLSDMYSFNDVSDNPFSFTIPTLNDAPNQYTLTVVGQDAQGCPTSDVLIPYEVEIEDCGTDMRPFVTTWITNNPGVSCDSCIRVPTTGGGYNYEVDWDYVMGDSFVADTAGITGDFVYNFGREDTVTIAIRGDFPRIFFNDSDVNNENEDSDKLISIDQWGDIEWKSMANAFEGCVNLNCFTNDIPNLKMVSSMNSMFFRCTNFEGDMKNWDVSQIESMGQVFSACRKFNSDLSLWDVSNVNNMSNIFSNCWNFNSDLNTWDVSSVVNMQGMFSSCFSFNSDLSTWDVGSVQRMNNMFRNATLFNSDISSWVVSEVTEMQFMFYNARSFNQNIDTKIITLSDQSQRVTWDVSDVTSLYSMFDGASDFNHNLANWNIGSAEQLNFFFSNTGLLSGPFDNSGLSCENYSSTLQGWVANPNTPDNLEMQALGMMYNEIGEAARDSLVSKGWTITGDESCVEQPCPSIDWINVPTDISINCDQLASIDLDLAYTNNGQTDCEFAGSVPADTTITTLGCDKIITLDWTAMENGETITAEQKITITNIPVPEWIDPPSDKTINCDDISNIDDQLSYSNGEQGICEISGQINATIDISQALCVEDRTLRWILPKSNQDCYPMLEYTQQITVVGCNDFIINDDFLSATTREELQYDLLDNDIYPIGDHTISILSIGDALVVDTSLSQDGDFSFRLADSFFDTIKVEYEVCDTFCMVCDTATFFITDEILEDIIPTSVITPNNDGTNDLLRFTRDEMIEESELWIYNRWGDQLYHQTDYTNDWDASGIPAGVYFYVLRVRGIELKKTLTILK